MAVTANASGIAEGKFTIPADVSAGSKMVRLEGNGGSFAVASFFGSSAIEVQELRQVTTTRTLVIDPLAQTFSIATSAGIGGVDLFVLAKGTTPILAQIRETTVGFPNQTILAETQLAPDDITVGQWNRFTFPMPTTLLPDVEYALVVLCNDPVGEVAVAELGKQDTTAGQWVTSQPYQVGVLLSSSNASTWTAHQDKDMAFRLLAARYTETSRTINLGQVDVTDASDILSLMPVIQPATGADAELSVTLPNGDVVRAGDQQTLRLPSMTTGSVGVQATLRATQTASAALLPGTQIVAGAVHQTADYVTRAFDADATGARVLIVFDANLPSGANCLPSVSGSAEPFAWVPASQIGVAKPLGDGFFEYTFELTYVEHAAIRVKLELSGSVAVRPLVKNLRVSVT